jgi:hypothetical protein
VRTLDVRLLVRGSHDAAEALGQLLTGVLRVHAAVELVTTPSGLVVPVAPVYRAPRSVTHLAVARTWDGGVLAGPTDHPARDVADLTQLVPPTREPS